MKTVIKQEHGTRVTYCPTARSSRDVTSREFYGKDHAQAAIAHMTEVAKVAGLALGEDGQPGQHYHYYAPIVKE